MNTEKIANAYELLEVLGDLDDAARSLRKAGRSTEAEVIRRVSEIMESELDPEAAKIASLLDEDDDEPALLRLGVSKFMTPQQKMKMRRKIKMHRPRAKIWVCCTKPKKQMTHGKSHKQMWLSTCKYKMTSGKMRGQVRSMRLVVGRDPKKAPRQVMRKGKKVRWC